MANKHKPESDIRHPTPVPGMIIQVRQGGRIFLDAGGNPVTEDAERKTESGELRAEDASPVQTADEEVEKC